MTAVIGMSVGLAPNRQAATTLADACGIALTAESLMLFGDLERAWVVFANEKKPDEE